MIQIIFSIYFFVQFYKRSKQVGKNPVLWSILGGGCFLLISGTIPDAIAYAVYYLIAEEAFLLARVIGIIVGLIAAVVITNKVLARALPETGQPNVTALDKFDIATGRQSVTTPAQGLIDVPPNDASGEEAAKALRSAGSAVLMKVRRLT